MTATAATRWSAALGLLAVGLGAFGAHGLEKVLTANDRVATWETAVFYHFIHAVMLYIVATRSPFARGAWWSFFIGILIFSGTLYVLCLTNLRWLGAITPLGGVSLMVGWFLLLVHRAGPADSIG